MNKLRFYVLCLSAIIVILGLHKVKEVIKHWIQGMQWQNNLRQTTIVYWLLGQIQRISLAVLSVSLTSLK